MVSDTVSSARQRRRKTKQKQDLLGRKSRSSSETQKKETHSNNWHEKVASDTDDVDRSEIDPDVGPDEMDDFVSLLHCTLHFSEAEAQTTCSPAHPPPGPPLVTGEGLALPSGRLAERIRALRLYACMYLFRSDNDCV